MANVTTLPITEIEPNSLSVEAYRLPGSVDGELSLGVACRGRCGEEDKLVCYIAEGILGRETKPGLINNSAFTLSSARAQGLLDSLWRAGIRPSDMGDYEKIKKATENHLADLRDITFRLLAASEVSHEKAG